MVSPDDNGVYFVAIVNSSSNRTRFYTDGASLETLGISATALQHATEGLKVLRNGLAAKKKIWDDAETAYGKATTATDKAEKDGERVEAKGKYYADFNAIGVLEETLNGIPSINLNRDITVNLSKFTVVNGF